MVTAIWLITRTPRVTTRYRTRQIWPHIAVRRQATKLYACHSADDSGPYLPTHSQMLKMNTTLMFA